MSNKNHSWYHNPPENSIKALLWFYSKYNNVKKAALICTFNIFTMVTNVECISMFDEYNQGIELVSSKIITLFDIITHSNHNCLLMHKVIMHTIYWLAPMYKPKLLVSPGWTFAHYPTISAVALHIIQPFQLEHS